MRSLPGSSFAGSHRELVPDPANPRLHGRVNLDTIAASLRRFGQAEPLVVQKGTLRVIAGHGRLAAMRALGLDGVRTSSNWTSLRPTRRRSQSR